MDNLIVITAKQVGKQELCGLVESWGGYWNDDPTLDQGVVERRRAAIYISLCDKLEPEYGPEEMRNLELWIGGPPQACVDIHISHGRGSPQLAQEFGRAVIDRWGGYLDNLIGDIPPPP